MPTIPLSDWSSGLNPEHMLEVSVTMTFMDHAANVLRRRRLERLIKLSKAKKTEKMVSILPDDLDFLAKTQPFKEQNDALINNDVMIHGAMAGDILMYLIAISLSGDGSTSLDKSLELTCKDRAVQCC